MKRLLALFFAVVLIYNSLGYYIVISYTRFVLRNEIRACIRSGRYTESCLTFRFQAGKLGPEMKRINRDEILYKGQMYDIISEDTCGGIITVKCLQDEKETQLIALFKKSVEHNFGQHTPVSAKHMSALLHHMVTAALITKSVALVHFSSQVITFSEPVYPLLVSGHSPELPPPEILIS